MKTISQRELRNDNADVMREVEEGESFTVTRRGVPIAVLAPISNDGGLRCVRPAKSRPDFRKIKRVSIEGSTAEILDDLRGDR